MLEYEESCVRPPLFTSRTVSATMSEPTILSPTQATLSEPSPVAEPIRRGRAPVASVIHTAESKFTVPATKSPVTVIDKVYWLYSAVPEVAGCLAPLSVSIAQICLVTLLCRGIPGANMVPPSGDQTGWPIDP